MYKYQHTRIEKNYIQTTCVYLTASKDEKKTIWRSSFSFDTNEDNENRDLTEMSNVLSNICFHQSNAIAEHESTLLIIVSMESATSKSTNGSNLGSIFMSDSSKSYKSGRKVSSVSSILIDVDEGVE